MDSIPTTAIKRQGGSKCGRLTYRSHTGCAGIRFEWVNRPHGVFLRILATGVDSGGRPRRTSYSVEHNGLEGALDLAITARMRSPGVPAPDRAALLDKLRAEYATRKP